MNGPRSNQNLNRSNKFPKSNSSHPAQLARKPTNIRNANSSKPVQTQQRQQQQPQQNQPNSSTSSRSSNKLGCTLNLTRCEILTEQIRKNKCECMVCCTNIYRDKAVWSCNVCFHIFHLQCVRKWALSPAAKVEGR